MRNARQAYLWSLHDFAVGRGLEIGPLHNTTVTREQGDVHYLDVFDRDGLVDQYGNDPGVDVDAIPSVDFPLSDGDRVRGIPEAVDGATFDWVMASHVIEHVPDLVGWLRQIAEVTVDGGHLVLAVPDRRYCFDVHRPGTTVGQMIQAHELGDVVPSVRAVYDYRRGHASLTTTQAWAADVPGYENRIYGLDTVKDLVERARRGEYVDSHVWTFTPGSLVEQVIELRDLGLCEWRFESWTQTRPGQLEFYAVLRRLPRSGWNDEDLAHEPRPVDNMPDWLASDLRARKDLSAARQELDRRRAELDVQREELRRLRRKLRRSRRRVRTMRTSTRWRLGGALTLPIRTGRHWADRILGRPRP